MAMQQQTFDAIKGRSLLTDDDHKVSFEVKLTFVVSILFFYPVALCIQLHKKPSVKFWVGDWLSWIAFFVAVWILFCHFALVSRIMRKTQAAMLMIIFPGAVLAVTCQVQELRFRSASSALLSNDCQSFAEKAQLERAWLFANELMGNCSRALSDITGAGMAETRMVTRIESCEGYAEGAGLYGKEWSYLDHMERAHRCGGWCEPSRPLWHPSQPIQDSCASAAARVIGSSIARMGLQVTVYSGLLLLSSSVALLLAPGLLGAA